MSRKTKAVGARCSASAKPKSKTRSKTKSAAPSGKKRTASFKASGSTTGRTARAGAAKDNGKAKRAGKPAATAKAGVKTKTKTIVAKRSARTKTVVAKRPARTRTAVAKRPNRGKARGSTEAFTGEVLTRVEADIASVIESLNTQMNTALASLTELAAAKRGRGEAVIRTAPLDRATAMFQRLLNDVVDEHVSGMLPTLVALRCEMADRAGDAHSADSHDDDFFDRGAAMLDQVLSSARVSRFDAREGEAFDSLIHLAIGETARDDLADGMVSESFRPGFRCADGKVIAPARVKVNRR